jgi:hypothetical protein
MMLRCVHFQVSSLRKRHAKHGAAQVLPIDRAPVHGSI